jgi:tetratricopeptide (TPR) repeat protein
MEQDFEDRHEDVLQSVKRFESMLKRAESSFFDLDTFEQIVEHYMEEGKFEEASQACEIALEQYPYSVELMLCKAELSSSLGEYDEALEILARAELFNPSDNDITF